MRISYSAYHRKWTCCFWCIMNALFQRCNSVDRYLFYFFFTANIITWYNGLSRSHWNSVHLCWYLKWAAFSSLLLKQHLVLWWNLHFICLLFFLKKVWSPFLVFQFTYTHMNMLRPRWFNSIYSWKMALKLKRLIHSCESFQTLFRLIVLEISLFLNTVSQNWKERLPIYFTTWTLFLCVPKYKTNRFSCTGLKLHWHGLVTSNNLANKNYPNDAACLSHCACKYYFSCELVMHHKYPGQGLWFSFTLSLSHLTYCISSLSQFQMTLKAINLW